VSVNPGLPTTAFGVGGPPSPDSRLTALWQRIDSQPSIPIPIPATAASVKLLTQACILTGWSLRETTSLSGLQVEFFDGADTTGVLVAEQTAYLPPSATSVSAEVDIDVSAFSGAAGATTVTLLGAAGATTFITGFEVTGTGATAAQVTIVTISGILGGSKQYALVIPAGITLLVNPLIVEFSRPIPASAVNTAIVVTVPSFGAGNTTAATTAHGFQRTSNAGGNGLGASATQVLAGPGPLLRGGLFMRVLAGTVTGAVWVKV
jgi:hypothetical protein